MALYSKFLFKKVVGYFVVISSLLIFLTWFAKSISFIKFITEYNVKISDFFLLFILILPWLSLFILPISLFISILIIYHKCNNDNLLVILKNAGLSKFQIACPALLVSLVLSIILLFISFYLMPFSNKKLKVKKNNFKSNYSNAIINPGSFSILGKFTIYVKNKNNNILYGIFIHSIEEDGASLTITSKTSKLINTKNKIFLELYNGTIQKFNIDNKNAIVRFDKYVILLKNKKNPHQLKWKAREKNISELLQDIRYSKKSLAEFHKRISYSLFPIALSLIALSFTLNNRFSRLMSSRNNIKAIILGAIFISINIAGYDLIEKHPDWTPAFYITLLCFLLFFFYFLIKKEKI